LVIPQRKIGGSTLTPDSDHPTRGFAEVWNADIHVIGTGQEATCWAMWIIGSDAIRTIRLVAEEDLRSRLNLANGTAVMVTIWEEEPKWTPPTTSRSFTNPHSSVPVFKRRRFFHPGLAQNFHAPNLRSEGAPF
jgi:hypothetical protein